MALDTWEKRTAILQNILVSVGLLASGAWVLFTFVELRAIQRSRAELAEIENRALPAVDAKLDVELLPGSDRTGVVLRATVENRTQRPVTLDMRAAPKAKIATPFGLARVALKPDGFFAPADVIRPPLQFIYPPAKRVLAAAPVTILTPGTSYFDAYTEVTEPGLYYVTFVAKLEDTARREIEQSLGFAPPKHVDSGIAVSQVFNVPPR